jgi:hypothetical protein
MHFAQKLVAEIVEMATNFAEDDDSPDLYRKITGHIDDEIIEAFRNSNPNKKQ